MFKIKTVLIKCVIQTKTKKKELIVKPYTIKVLSTLSQFKNFLQL